MQFQADILGKRIVVPTVLETTAMGAAYMAGLAVVFWSDTEELRGHSGE
jgi:glycerol kinase